MTRLSDDQERRPTGASTGARVPPTLDLGLGVRRASASTARGFEVENLAESGDDGFGALQSVELPEGPSVQYVHDPMGRRIARYEDGVRTAGWLCLDSLRPLAELSAGNEVTSVFADRFITDHLGSVRVVVRMSDGEVVERTAHDAWGRIVSGAAIDPMSPPQRGTCRDAPFGFAAGLHDSVTEPVHFGARECDPVTGRWMQKEPIRFAGGDTNIYAYVGGDPVNYSDPSGLILPLAIADGALADALAGAAATTTVAIAGGGAIADAVRDIDWTPRPLPPWPGPIPGPPIPPVAPATPRPLPVPIPQPVPMCKERYQPKNPPSDRCRDVAVGCRADCVHEMDGAGSTFWKCVNACLEANGCTPGMYSDSRHSRGTRDTRLNREVAARVSATMLRFGAEIEESVKDVKANCSIDEHLAYREACSRLMLIMLVDVMNPIYLEHPELCPPELRRP